MYSTLYYMFIIIYSYSYLSMYSTMYKSEHVLYSAVLTFHIPYTCVVLIQINDIRVFELVIDVLRLETECVRCFALLLEHQLSMALDAFRSYYSSLVRRTEALLCFLLQKRNPDSWYEFESRHIVCIRVRLLQFSNEVCSSSCEHLTLLVLPARPSQYEPRVRALHT